MATITFTHHLIGCDGCDAVFGMNLGACSLTEMRAAAYAAGWRFPPQLTAKSRRIATKTSDVCPACTGTWEPQAAGQSLARVLSAGQAAELFRRLTEAQS